MKIAPIIPNLTSTGFPSPAEDYIEKSLDLNELLVKCPAATFFIRVSGNLIETGIKDQDILIVDRSIKPTHGKVVIAAIDANLSIRRLKIKNKKNYLTSETEDFPSIQVEPENGVYIWGVVTFVIRSLDPI